MSLVEMIQMLAGRLGLECADWRRIPTLVPVGVAAYLVVVQALRYQRMRAMHREFNYPTRQAMAAMTNDDAQAIITYLSELEFPYTMFTSLQFALFRTYAIPTISKLLLATKQLSSRDTSSKRYADTTVLITEFVAFPPRHERAIRAIARMNYLHGLYIKSGKISNDDLLYTLSVFITQPIEWVNKLEWRQMTPMETCAIGTFWKSVGDSMGIDYTPLDHFDAWSDGLAFYEDIKNWATEYEKKCMLPAEPNVKVAMETTHLLLYWAPSWAFPMGVKAVAVMLDERLRKAMMFEPAPASYHAFINAALTIRRLTLRYLTLPRPQFMAKRNVCDEPNAKTGRYNWKDWQAHPWYLKPGFWNRWGPEALMLRLAGGDVPGDRGDLYFPGGYVIEEIGPQELTDKGADVMADWQKKMTKERPSGCPFAL